jgi:hypothetical protein
MSKTTSLYINIKDFLSKKKWSINRETMMQIIRFAFLVVQDEKKGRSNSEKKAFIIGTIQHLIVEDPHIDEIEMEICLELLESTLIGQAIEYMHIDHETIQKKKKWCFF